MKINLKTMGNELDPALAVATAIVASGCPVAPSFRNELLGFAERAGVADRQEESAGALDLFILDEVIRFASSVVGQAVLERIWDTTAIVDQPIHEAFSTTEGKSRCISRS